MARADQPTIFVIFGITGDLSRRKLMPALRDLAKKGYMPEQYRIVGYAHTDTTEEDFARITGELASKSEYIKGTFQDLDGFRKLGERLVEIDEEFDTCSNKLFYLAVPPNSYDVIFKNLAESGLTVPCSPEEGWTRVLVEKPFGRDDDTARYLDEELGKLFQEVQIFRIDHYLAKETLQNILAFRFSNALFEPLWNKDYISKVEIVLHETDGVGTRGEFYDAIGALRDVGQNHLLQMLALIAMERPQELAAGAIRAERAKVLALLKLSDNAALKRGQYQNYRQEKGVDAFSETETYFHIEACIDNDRWRGVPFAIESGKAMDENRVSITVYFKADNSLERENVLTFRIQPDEGISLVFWAKRPGFDMVLEPRAFVFSYKDSPEELALPDAYERVLYDCIRGDQTLFASTEEVRAAWKFITPIITAWKDVPLVVYDKGTNI